MIRLNHKEASGEPTRRGAAGYPAWLELARVSNAPTVVSNVLAAAALGSAAAGTGPSAGRLVAAAIGALLVYTAGMVLNDAADAPIDRVERPERPIPSGRISRAAAVMMGFGLLVTGGVIAGLSVVSAGGRAAVGALLACVMVYTLIHKRTRLGVVVMGACRGLAYMIAFGVIADPAAEMRWSAPAVGVLLYTAALSFVARSESSPRPPASVLRWLPCLCALASVVSAGAPTVASMAACGLIVALHIAAATRIDRSRPAGVRAAVHLWIAGFCLTDAGVAAAAGRLDFAVVCLGCCVLTMVAHRRILGT